MANVRHIQLLRKTAYDWEEEGTVLLDGEIGIDTTNKRLKVGDGISTWEELPYYDAKDDVEDLQNSLKTVDGGKAQTAESEYKSAGSIVIPAETHALPEEEEITTVEDD